MTGADLLASLGKLFGSRILAKTEFRGETTFTIGREHIRRHGWEEALHTLLHEMVHQWQDEAGHPIDHGATFRRKAREVGITASARRHVVPVKRARPLPPPPAVAIGLRAARDA